MTTTEDNMKNTLNTEFPDVGAAQFHIRLTEGQIAPYVLLPGAPERVELVKKQWKNAVDLEFNREFRSAKGTYDGMDIACVSTGIGTTSAEICLHELKNIGAHTTVRIGTISSDLVKISSFRGCSSKGPGSVIFTSITGRIL